VRTSAASVSCSLRSEVQRCVGLEVEWGGAWPLGETGVSVT
jgi:hypothetical protein